MREQQRYALLPFPDLLQQPFGVVARNQRHAFIQFDLFQNRHEARWVGGASDIYSKAKYIYGELDRLREIRHSDTSGTIAEVWDWPGRVLNTMFGYGIEAAGKALAAYVATYTFAEGEKLNIVAHSHGGNVVKEYTWNSNARRIDVLVTMGTPQRGDFSINMNLVSSYLNVYSKHDHIQPAGGQWWQYWLGGPLFGLLSSAGRTDRCAINIGVDHAPGVGNVGHGELHTAAVWREMLAWLGRANLSIHQPNVNGTLNSNGGCPTGPTGGGSGGGGGNPGGPPLILD